MLPQAMRNRPHYLFIYLISYETILIIYLFIYWWSRCCRVEGAMRNCPHYLFIYLISYETILIIYLFIGGVVGVEGAMRNCPHYLFIYLLVEWMLPQE